MAKTKNVFLSMLAILVLLSAVLFPARAQNAVRADGEQFTGDDLRGTTWQIKNHPSFYGDTYALSFTSNGNTYTELRVESGGSAHLYIYYNSTAVLDYRESNDSYTWLNELYRTISITDGTDAVSGGTNFNSLVTWLNANATLQPSGGGNGGGASNTGVVEDIVVPTIVVALLGLTAVFIATENKKKNIKTK